MLKTLIIIIAAIMLVGIAIKFLKGTAKLILILIAISFVLPYILPYIKML